MSEHESVLDVDPACAWSDYRSAYGATRQDFKHFKAGWDAAHGVEHQGVQSGSRPWDRCNAGTSFDEIAAYFRELRRKPTNVAPTPRYAARTALAPLPEWIVPVERFLLPGPRVQVRRDEGGHRGWRVRCAGCAGWTWGFHDHADAVRWADRHARTCRPKGDDQ